MSSSSTSTSTSTTADNTNPAPAPAPAQAQAPKQLNFPGAINVLIQGINIAQTKGVYTLADANLLHQSIQLVNQVMVKSFGAQATPAAQESKAPGKDEGELEKHDDNDDEDVEDKVGR